MNLGWSMDVESLSNAQMADNLPYDKKRRTEESTTNEALAQRTKKPVAKTEHRKIKVQAEYLLDTFNRRHPSHLKSDNTERCCGKSTTSMCF